MIKNDSILKCSIPATSTDCKDTKMLNVFKSFIEPTRKVNKIDDIEKSRKLGLQRAENVIKLLKNSYYCY